jgi:hypothetical protein
MRAIWKDSSICLICQTQTDEDSFKAMIGEIPLGQWVKGTARFRATREAGGYYDGTDRTVVEVRLGGKGKRRKAGTDK